MMATNLLYRARKFIFNLCVLICASLLTVGYAHAAHVIYEDVSFISGINGVGGTNTRFTVTESGIYQAELVDFVFPTRFDTLGLSITEGATTELNRQITTNGSFSFNFEAHPGLYFANVFGDAGGAMNIGMYGLKISHISAVPVPTALALFISALLVLLFFTDNGRACKNRMLSVFDQRLSWKPA